MLLPLLQVTKLRGIISQATVQRLVSALMPKLDYCNAVLTSLPSFLLVPLQHVLHTAAHLVTSPGPRDHITGR